MKTTSLTRTLFIASAIGLAGAAQADAIFYPDGTSMELRDSSTDTVAMESAIDTTVLGAAPAATTTYSYVYVQPNINFDRHAAMTQLRDQRRAMHDKHVGSEKAAAATFNVPSRAGEASTMTGGAPNMVTDNNSFVVGSRHIPHSSLTVNQPYYVLSY